jgi:hypothetical protein
MDYPMTQEQEKVFGTICALLDEHFNGSTVSVVYEDEKGNQYIRHWYSGGRVLAIGLMRAAEQEMVHEQINQDELEDS